MFLNILSCMSTNGDPVPAKIYGRLNQIRPRNVRVAKPLKNNAKL